MKYIYDVEKECFKREDNRGKPLYVNITEAQKIALQLDLGYPLTQIEGKIALANPQGTATTIKSFIRNYKQGNIIMPEDAPVPVRIFDEMTDSTRIDNLEKRVSILENILSELKSDCFISSFATENSTEENEFNPIGKVKEWLNL